MAKKKKPYKYLKFYRECMETGFMPSNGLCDFFGKRKLFKLMIPTAEDLMKIKLQKLPILYWGWDSWDVEVNRFTPLRQNIVLFMAAMNNEL